MLVGLVWLCGNLSGGVPAAYLSQYRSFRLGMDVPSVAKLAGMSPSEVKVLYSKPARVEELAWYPNLGAGPEGRPDPIRSALFSFYDGSLYNIVVTYDDSKTQKLGKNSLLVRGFDQEEAKTKAGARLLEFGPDLHSFTIWDTIQNLRCASPEVGPGAAEMPVIT